MNLAQRPPARHPRKRPRSPDHRPTGARRLSATLLVLALTVLAAALSSTGAAQQAPPAVPPSPPGYRLEVLATGLRLPVAAVPLYDTGALLVVALDGSVFRYQDGRVEPDPFLSLAGRVTGLLGEQGLFSVALEPRERAAARGGPAHLVAAFTEAGTNDLVVAAYPLLPDLDGADGEGEVVLLRQPMPQPFHHGGQVAFGPDGMLYVSIGDGQQDPAYLYDRPHAAQDLSSLRGKVLRLDPFPQGSAAPYAVPSDNPFTPATNAAAAAAGARGEVWAYGFRNPWKFTFAPSDGALLLADVGEDRWEEIDLVAAGANYGWPVREGPECFHHPEDGTLVAGDCEALATVAPIAYYGHPGTDEAGGKSVVGGVEVTDRELPSLRGAYLFGDFISGRLWALDRATGEVRPLLERAGAMLAIVAGPQGEVLLLTVDGTLARLREAPAE